MTQEHPITPPPELVQQWLGNYFGCVVNGELSDSEKYLATQAARWGADQELEACCEWVKGHWLSDELRASRRPKPPILKEQALSDFENLMGELIGTERYRVWITSIRRALESLPD